MPIDKENGDTLWADAVAKEMKNIREAKEIQWDGIFDVKMDGFARKHRMMLAGGHTTEALESLTRASFVSRESVRVVLTMAALNNLEVKAADVRNAWLTAPVSEKKAAWTRFGCEFGFELPLSCVPCMASRVLAHCSETI
jgi:hypothetical protein